MPICLKWIQYFDSVLLCVYRTMYYRDIILIFEETAKFYAKYVEELLWCLHDNALRLWCAYQN